MCENCGYYKGKEVVNVASKLLKKQEKMKARQKELGTQPAEENKSEEEKEAKPLNASELSKK
jgi:hypothetical protein